MESCIPFSFNDCMVSCKRVWGCVMVDKLSQEQSFRSYWFLFFCGICMGAADLIPGISGGTIAFIMGFYHQLLDSVKTINLSSLKLLFTGRFYLFFQAVAWKFLL